MQCGHSPRQICEPNTCQNSVCQPWLFDARWQVIENEYGESSIDDKLIKKNSKFRSDEEIVEVLNGCVCCSVRQDLVAILHKLANKAKAGKVCGDRPTDHPCT